MHSSSNLPRTLADAQDAGWLVIGADAGPNASECGSVSIDRPTVLVVGSEGAGLRTNVRRACTMLVRVAASPALDARLCDSLNVSVATGILLHQCMQRAARGAVAA